MEVKDIELQLKSIIVSCGKNVKLDQINEDSDLIQELAYDSMNFIQLIAELEMEFDIEIDETEIDLVNLSKYKSLVELVISKLVK
ncbi:acyl carrier protein [Paenibacillus polysaccharolyticus]|uniref:acyl carrier protein n=1 Tax=Paenibacillus polysaccharolyticus TaxID=582692 RepID=UPI00203FC01B|nr:acyl carrier protein [Paenibacillus polysaccharolyticus]MCM3135791.1 acyl carrier protein [Paenibacillus polysaccharolyticus]